MDKQVQQADTQVLKTGHYMQVAGTKGDTGGHRTGNLTTGTKGHKYKGLVQGNGEQMYKWARKLRRSRMGDR